MKEFVSEKDQLDNIEKFKKILDKNPGGLNLALLGLSTGIDQIMANAGNDIIDGKMIKDTEIYKQHLPIFIGMAKKKIDKYTMAEPLGITEKGLLTLKEKQNKGEKITFEEVWNLFGLDISNIPKFDNLTEFKEQTFKQLLNKITPEVNQKLNEKIYLNHKKINQMLNAVEAYKKISKKTTEKIDPELKEYLSLKLYSDAVEIYLKVLHEYYGRLTDIPLKGIEFKNDEMYTYFQNNYPLIWDSPYNKLRNDVCHLTYEERGKYTIDQIDETRMVVLFKAMTGTIARNIVLAEIFQKAVFSDEHIFDDVLEVITGLLNKVEEKENKDKNEEAIP